MTVANVKFIYQKNPYRNNNTTISHKTERNSTESKGLDAIYEGVSKVTGLNQ